MAFRPVGNRSPLDVNIENEQAYRDKSINDLMLGRRGPGGVATHGFDALYGAGMRQAEAGNRLNISGIGQESRAMPSASRSLRRAVEPEFDATAYQQGRADLDRTLDDNFARKWGQRDALNDADRARDPNLVDYDAKRSRDRAAAGVAAADESAIDSFQRREPLRRATHRENVQYGAAEVEVDPRVVVARETTRRGENTNQSKEDIEIIRAQGKNSVAGQQAYARIVSGMAMSGIPQEEIIKRVDTAIGDLGFTSPAPAAPPAETPSLWGAIKERIAGRPAAPAPKPATAPSASSSLQRSVGGDPSAPLKQLSPEYDFSLLVDKYGSVKAADEWLNANGYTR